MKQIQNLPVWFGSGKLVLAEHNCTDCGGWWKKGAAGLSTCRKECNKYALTDFWLVHHNDSSRWFGISSPPPICCANFRFMGGFAKEYITKLGCEKYFLQGRVRSTARDVLTGLTFACFTAWFPLTCSSSIAQSPVVPLRLWGWRKQRNLSIMGWTRTGDS
jgi:hypothetical protein